MFTEHEIAIPSVLKVGDGMLGNMGEILKSKDISHVVLYFGNGLIDLFGDRVVNSINEAGIKIHEMKELDSVDIDDIIDLAFSVDNEVQAICGIGGGKVIDAAKYASYLRKMQFISVPTSTSSDGFTSSSASLLVNGKRTSVPAKMAYGIIVDTGVLKTAPVKFIHSGVGDLTAKITSLYDWVYEEQCGATVVDDFALMIAKKAVNSFVRTPFESITDELFLKELVDSLAMSGIANEIAGSSAPVSGSEHLISHALDSFLERPELHGVQVGIATYLMALVQEHRVERIKKIFTDTGFFDYVETLGMKKADYKKAVDMAPLVKPHRHTYLHEEKYREKAKELIDSDEFLNKILV